MQLTVTVKLNTTPADHHALVKTLRTCNAACDDISATAFATGTFRQYDLHALVYHPVKAETKLNANHIVRAIAKVADAYKLDTKVQRTFAPLGGIEAEPFAHEGVIGVDLGIVNVATDSQGNRYTGEPVKKVRKKYRRLRQQLQA